MSRLINSAGYVWSEFTSVGDIVLVLKAQGIVRTNTELLFFCKKGLSARLLLVMLQCCAVLASEFNSVLMSGLNSSDRLMQKGSVILI